jgi:hypothetical protein
MVVRAWQHCSPHPPGPMDTQQYLVSNSELWRYTNTAPPRGSTKQATVRQYLVSCGHPTNAAPPRRSTAVYQVGISTKQASILYTERRFLECRWETTTSVLRVMTSKSQRMERKTVLISRSSSLHIHTNLNYSLLVSISFYTLAIF